MNKKEKIINVYNMLNECWFSLDKLPEHYSFRCLIKFDEIGFEGVDRNHISTGYWWHIDECFSIDFDEMKDFTPKYFIPLYSKI